MITVIHIPSCDAAFSDDDILPEKTAIRRRNGGLVVGWSYSRQILYVVAAVGIFSRFQHRHFITANPQRASEQLQTVQEQKHNCCYKDSALIH